MSNRNRTFLTMEVLPSTSIAANDIVTFDLENLKNPQYALGYPPDQRLLSETTLVVQFLSTVATSTGPVLAAVFRFEWRVAVVPRSVQNFSVSFDNLAVAEYQRINMSFINLAPIPEFARFAIWFPAAAAVDSPNAGFDVFQTSGSISVTDARAVALTATVQVGLMATEIVAPNTCNEFSSSGPISSFAIPQKNCTYNSVCTALTATQSSYAPASLLLQRSFDNKFIGEFIVPEIDGRVCNVSGPVRSQPGDWLVPTGCNISRSYRNVTRAFTYYIAVNVIPAGSVVTLMLNGVRNPLRFANCSGWFDLQIQHMSSSGWPMAQRGIRACQGAPGTGRITDSVILLSNTTAGAYCRPFAA